MSTVKIHREFLFVPLSWDDNIEKGKMVDVKRKNGKRVEFKTIASAEAYCVKNKIPFIGSNVTTVYRVNNKKNK